MNSEVISSRYAKALLAYAAEAGSGNIVYSQTLVIVHIMQDVPQLMDIVLNHDEVALNKKIDLLSLAIGEHWLMSWSGLCNLFLLSVEWISSIRCYCPM